MICVFYFKAETEEKYDQESKKVFKHPFTVVAHLKSIL